MFKIVIALKSLQQFKCTVKVNNKSKELSVPHSEGLLFHTSSFPQISIDYQDDVYIIEVPEDKEEVKGEFKINHIRGSYFIMILQEEEKPQQLDIKQDESPIRSYRSNGKTKKVDKLYTESKIKKKINISTPNIKQKTETSRLETSVDHLSESECNGRLNQKLDKILKQQIPQFQPQPQQQNETQLEVLAKQYTQIQKRYDQDVQNLLDQLSEIQKQFTQLLEQKNLADQEISRLKTQLLNKDVQMASIQVGNSYNQNLQDMQIATEIMLQQYQTIMSQCKENDPQIIDNLVKLIINMRQTGSPYIAAKDDKIDIKLSQLIIRETGISQYFVRLKEGLYKNEEQLANIIIQEGKLFIQIQDQLHLLQDYIQTRYRKKTVKTNGSQRKLI